MSTNPGTIKRQPYIAAALLFLTPLISVYALRFNVDVSGIEKEFSHNKANYKDSIQILLSCSQWLVTVSISTFAATGYLFIRSREHHPTLCYVFSLISLCSGIVSIYCAIILFQYSSVYLFFNMNDINYINGILKNQSFFALIAACSMSVLMLGAREA